MKLSKELHPEDLKEPEYELLDTIDHDDLISFIKQAFQHKNWVFYFHNILNLVFVAFFFGLMIKDVFNGHLRLSREFGYFSMGAGITFLLIPVHEFIHALAYKSIGAKNTSYDMNLRKFYFLAMADKFVVGQADFRKVILAPFTMISVLCILFMFLVPGIWIFAPLGVLLTHTLFCSGDFGLLCYLETNKDKEIYTYDDKAEGQSFFFSRRSHQDAIKPHLY